MQSLSPEVRLENEAWTWKLPGGSDYTLNPNFSLILLISLLAKNPECVLLLIRWLW